MTRPPVARREGVGFPENYPLTLCKWNLQDSSTSHKEKVNTMNQNSKDHGKQAAPSRRRFLKLAAVAGGMLGFPGITQVANSQPGSPGIIQTSSKSSRPSITIAGYPFDRIKGLVDGKVKVEGCDTRFDVSGIYKLNAMAMGGDQKWEVQEIGLHPFMLAYGNNNFRDIHLDSGFPPAYLSAQKYFHPNRSWHQHTGGTYAERRSLTAGYSQSSLTWIRGILQHEYDLKPEDMQWIISTKSSDKGKVSKNESALPEGRTDHVRPRRGGRIRNACGREGRRRVFCEGTPSLYRWTPQNRAPLF